MIMINLAIEMFDINMLKKRKVREIHVAILLLSSDMKIVQMCMIYPEFD